VRSQHALLELAAGKSVPLRLEQTCSISFRLQVTTHFVTPVTIIMEAYVLHHLALCLCLVPIRPKQPGY
jgi:hypothetical protein